MSHVARLIDPSDTPCPRCGTTMLITHDAIGRPRERCPQCQGVVREPLPAGTVGPLHRQSATCRAELTWRMAPTPPPQARSSRIELQSGRASQRRRLSVPALRHCEDCGCELPAQATGRPRRRCADRQACARRWRGGA